MVYYQAALLADDRNFRAGNELGVLLAKCGKLERAKQMFLRSLAISPQPATWHNLAKIHERLGETKLAAAARAHVGGASGRLRQIAGGEVGRSCKLCTIDVAFRRLDIPHPLPKPRRPRRRRLPAQPSTAKKGLVGMASLEPTRPALSSKGRKPYATEVENCALVAKRARARFADSLSVGGPIHRSVPAGAAGRWSCRGQSVECREPSGERENVPPSWRPPEEILLCQALSPAPGPAAPNTNRARSPFGDLPAPGPCPGVRASPVFPPPPKAARRRTAGTGLQRRDTLEIQASAARVSRSTTRANTWGAPASSTSPATGCESTTSWNSSTG